MFVNDYQQKKVNKKNANILAKHCGILVLAVHTAGQLQCTFDMILWAKYNYTAGQIWPASMSLTHVA